jgi:CHAT domain-containing protein/tetratricopeptide (TPR) repeat protein
MLVADSHLDDGIAFQRAGHFKEADRELRAAITELSAAGNRPSLLKAFSIESWISVSLGNYSEAIQQATQAVELHRALRDEKHLGNDLNTLALANQNLGKYGAALDNFEQALRADRAAGDAEGEITRLNNIGNVYYFEGRYVDALRFYQQANSKVDASLTEPWNPRRRHVTLANIATVYQILGKEQTALDLYKSLATSSKTMPARERAQLLANEGALYRRLGDPVKALELYKSAQDLYESDRYSDGEIGVLRNMGIARAMDMGDPEGALVAFSGALRLACTSSNRRGAVQASLYRSEAFRLLHRLHEATAEAQYALEGAKFSGLVEEQWRSLYVLGRIAEEEGHRSEARKNYGEAVDLIESIRTGLQIASLRSEFLADKRDVYDALIGLRLNEDAPVDEMFQLIERSRARALNERVSLAVFQDLHAIQSHLGQNSMLLEFWTGADSIAVVWISPSRAGVVGHAGRIQDTAEKLIDALQTGSDQWHDTSRLLGDILLSSVPPARHLLVVPDGPLSGVPFEVVAEPRSKSLLIELSDISYLPSAQFIAREESPKSILFPWQRQLVAFGDPPVSSADALALRWQKLQASGAEIRSIERTLPGRSEVHVGLDAQKRYIEGSGVENLPILHLSTHALVDPEDPDRSRILLASDYLFQSEVYGLDLKGVDLVTVSACDTARGKTVRGEGVQAFSRAFLAAGANSTVTSLWRVADEPTAEFMKQFYYSLSRGQGKSEALRSAKLEFLHSGSRLANPRYWGAFVVTGSGLRPLTTVLPWSLVLLAGAAVFAVIAIAGRFAIRAGRPLPQRGVALTETHPL